LGGRRELVDHSEKSSARKEKGNVKHSISLIKGKRLDRGKGEPKGERERERF